MANLVAMESPVLKGHRVHADWTVNKDARVTRAMLAAMDSPVRRANAVSQAKMAQTVRMAVPGTMAGVDFAARLANLVDLAIPVPMVFPVRQVLLAVLVSVAT